MRRSGSSTCLRYYNSMGLDQVRHFLGTRSNFANTTMYGQNDQIIVFSTQSHNQSIKLNERFCRLPNT